MNTELISRRLETWSRDVAIGIQKEPEFRFEMKFASESTFEDPDDKLLRTAGDSQWHPIYRDEIATWVGEGGRDLLLFCASNQGMVSLETAFPEYSFRLTKI